MSLSPLFNSSERLYCYRARFEFYGFVCDWFDNKNQNTVSRVLLTFSIGNHMISSAIWNKQVRVNFSKTNKIARARRREIFSCILLVLVSSLSKCILRALLHFCRILDVCENDVFTFCVQREKLDLGTAREQKLISRLLEQQQGL